MQMNDCFQVIVPTASKVQVSKEFVFRLFKKIESLRPKKRILHWPAESFLAENTEIVASVMEDLTRIESGKDAICVEIKPKWGFIPKEYQACRFCMHQVFKFQKGEIEEISSYCPLLLFDPRKERKLLAISKLAENPQNNSKVFLSGKLLDLSQFKTILLERIGITIEKFWEIFAEILYQNHSVFELIKRIQMADYSDVQNLYPFWANSGLDFEKVDNAILSSEFSEKFLNRIPIGERQKSWHDIEHLLRTLTVDQKQEIIEESVQEYVISMTAKDPSIMFCIRFDESILQTPIYKLVIVDIDFKSSAKLEQWFKLDQQIKQTFANCKNSNCKKG
jgi:inositol-pentakisphosphate 2-kinase